LGEGVVRSARFIEFIGFEASLGKDLFNPTNPTDPTNRSPPDAELRTVAWFIGFMTFGGFIGQGRSPDAMNPTDPTNPSTRH
jgi:hypothetical protein